MASDTSPAWHRFTRPPIIIGGSGRSGTTLLLSILSCHSRIFAIKTETSAFCTKATDTPDGPQRRFDQLARWLEHADIPASCWRWCEKTPRNVRFFGRILEAFGEDVRLIHMVRDGRDVITSVHPRRPHEFWVPKKRWIKDVASGLAFADHPQVLTVRYEDLTLDYRATVTTICQFLDEEFEPSLLQYPDSATITAHKAWFLDAQPVHAGSVARWNAPQHRVIVDQLMADPRAVELLDRLGYWGGDRTRASSHTTQGRARPART
jgi:Sulfotransferase family